MRTVEARVASNEAISEGFRILAFDEPDLGPIAPGQFVQVLCRESGRTDPFLRRPFSVMDLQDGQLRLLYKVIGKGTEIMAGWRPGDRVSLLGPLGQGFAMDFQATDRVLVIAGGTGLGGVAYLLRALAASGVERQLYYGVRTDAEVPKATLESLGAETEVVVQARDGFVTEKLAELDLSGFTRCAVCGPLGMIEACVKLVGDRIPLVEVSLEEMMGCGFGICYTCPVARSDGQGYFSACDDGPVFRPETVRLGVAS